MSKVHAGLLRVRTPDGSDPPADLLQFAKKAMGALLENVERQNLPSATRTHRFPDGSVVTAAWDGTMPTVTITPPKTTTTHSDVTASTLWVPRGLIVYPAYHDAPFGVGLPIITDTDKDPYGPRNLAPGVDRQYWTPGGPCGEVLLTKDKDAGYPDKRLLVSPLLYDDTYGPGFKWFGKGAYDSRPTTSPWTAYRIEFAVPQQMYPEEAPAQTLVLRQQVNSFRIANGMDSLYLPPRGYYDAGAVMASIMYTAGGSAAESVGYPPPYRTGAQRVTKDGYSAFLLGGPFTSWNRGDNLTTFELRSAAGGASAVMDAWQSDNNATAELVLEYGPAGFLDIGYRGGYWCADFSMRTSWIAAGNCYWKSDDPDIPPVSWYGFASVNLAWETYPAMILGGVDGHTPTLTPIYAFTDSNGACWLNYSRAKVPYAADVEPAMSRHIFMRGRSIALAPRGGLVWGACVQPMDKADRLIALVHHPEDQPSDYTTNGWTRYLRVWWCDIPRREHLRADPQATICGEDPADTWSWKGGQLLDVGHIPAQAPYHIPDGKCSSIKYASQWKFNKAGTKAVCLRDYGLYTDYVPLLSGDVISEVNGLSPRRVELQFNTTATDTNTSVAFPYWMGFTGDGFDMREIAGLLNTTDPFPNALHYYENKLDHAIAVDFGAQDELIFVRTGSIDVYGLRWKFTYYYIGTAPDTVKWTSDLQNLVVQGVKYRTEQHNFSPFGDPIVVDVVTGAFVSEGVHPMWFVNAPADTADAVRNPDSVCFPFTDAPVHGVRMWRNTQLLDESWYPAPDGLVTSVVDSCIDRSDPAHPNGLRIIWLPLAASGRVQSYLAENQGGSVFCTQVSPVPIAARFLDSVPNAPDCGCRQTTKQILEASHHMNYDELNPRGGRVIATVPLPDYDWLIYAKVV